MEVEVRNENGALIKTIEMIALAVDIVAELAMGKTLETEHLNVTARLHRLHFKATLLLHQYRFHMLLSETMTRAKDKPKIC